MASRRGQKNKMERDADEMDEFRRWKKAQAAEQAAAERAVVRPNGLLLQATPKPKPGRNSSQRRVPKEMTAMPPPSEINKVRSDGEGDVWVHLGFPSKVDESAGSSPSKLGGAAGSSTAASASQPGLSPVGSLAS